MLRRRVGLPCHVRLLSRVAAVLIIPLTSCHRHEAPLHSREADRDKRLFNGRAVDRQLHHTWSFLIQEGTVSLFDSQSRLRAEAAVSSQCKLTQADKQIVYSGVVRQIWTSVGRCLWLSRSSCAKGDH
jgi:hypothetical protein